MKWLLITLIIGCAGTMEYDSKLIRDKVTEIFNRKNGTCEYTVEPRRNYRVTVLDKCGKYDIGDTLTRKEYH